jgi:hypothetical protein
MDRTTTSGIEGGDGGIDDIVFIGDDGLESKENQKVQAGVVNSAIDSKEIVSASPPLPSVESVLLTTPCSNRDGLYLFCTCFTVPYLASVLNRECVPDHANSPLKPTAELLVTVTPFFPPVSVSMDSVTAQGIDANTDTVTSTSITSTSIGRLVSSVHPAEIPSVKSVTDVVQQAEIPLLTYITDVLFGLNTTVVVSWTEVEARLQNRATLLDRDLKNPMLLTLLNACRALLLLEQGDWRDWHIKFFAQRFDELLPPWPTSVEEIDVHPNSNWLPLFLRLVCRHVQGKNTMPSSSLYKSQDQKNAAIKPKGKNRVQGLNPETTNKGCNGTRSSGRGESGGGLHLASVDDASASTAITDAQITTCILSGLIRAAEVTKDVNAQAFLGWCYRFGVGVTANVDFAVRSWTLAARSGHVRAMYWIFQLAERPLDAKMCGSTKVLLLDLEKVKAKAQGETKRGSITKIKSKKQKTKRQRYQD